ncbi:two-component system regulatory protein YycI [Facklamia sp. 7083-14-GEN3]|uniref:two-component system regulatory protein YycI n=1 Tax=Facklamia sp. 7083-14-GEN3 TaxID=2973478 RepID=UPI00215BE0CE|nr:two-component system regulatory protein YycI [Facklamia sp. 7083-14-GEN3]MCR8969556.1 two-component system regulatory protein YycI [Facklamia sp. 7083-14-GEN3]
MDFKRIQIILLVFFIMFDIFLAYLLVERGAFGLNFQDPTSQINPVQEMKDRGIKFSSAVEMNDNAPELAVLKNTPNNELWSKRQQLQNQNISIDPNGVLVSEFSSPVEMDISLGEETHSLTSEDFAWIHENILKDPTYFINGELYLNHWYSPQERMIIIRMVTKRGGSLEDSSMKSAVPISDGTAEIRILLDENYDMVSYMQTYQDPFVRLEDQRKLISTNEVIAVIENRIDTTLPNDAEIVSMTLGYFRSVETKQFNLYLPAWEVIYYRKENGQTVSVLVDAIKGNVVNTKTKT